MTAPLRHLFQESHRLFFLAGFLFALLSIFAWAFLLWAGSAPEFDMTGWHAHEMVFGYGAIVAGGFLLTSSGGRLPVLYPICAVLVWLAGRLVMWHASLVPLSMVAAVDLAFLPLIAWRLALSFLKRPKPQTAAFLGALGLVWFGNVAFHLDVLWGPASMFGTGAVAGMLGLCTLISVLGGRVVPGFTRNAMKRAEMDESRWPVSSQRLDRSASLATAATAMSVLTEPLLSLPGLFPVLAVCAGFLQLIRFARWRIWWTRRQPILWALHVAMFFLGIGLIAFGLSGLGIGSMSGAVHLLGIGALGGMTLAVMSRSILAQSGRPVIASPAVAFAYLFLACAAVGRWMASAVHGLSDLYIASAIILWLLAFTLALAALVPALLLPRLPRNAQNTAEGRQP